MTNCYITNVVCDDLSFQPIIANFQNGQLKANQVDKLQCAAFSNTKTNKTVVAVATEKITYIGSEDTSSDLCYTLLTIRNKRTNKIRLVPVNTVSLKAVVPNLGSAFDISLNSKNTMADLNKQFGSKRTKRRTEQTERMKMNVSNVEEELKQAVSEIKINAEDLVTPPVDENEKFYRPPINRNASTIDQIYDLKSIIKQEELDTLSEIANEVLENPIEANKFVPFVIENINEIKKSSSSKALLKCEMLLYMDAILKFFKIPVKNVGRKAFNLEPYPETIKSKIMYEFTVYTENSRTRPISMRDKATCHCIVIGLLALDYKLNIESLSKSLGIGVKKLLDISRILGAQTLSGKEKNCIVLSLPLPAPPAIMMGKRKKS